jgi:hypothetical protein
MKASFKGTVAMYGFRVPGTSLARRLRSDARFGAGRSRARRATPSMIRWFCTRLKLHCLHR